MSIGRFVTTVATAGLSLVLSCSSTLEDPGGLTNPTGGTYTGGTAASTGGSAATTGGTAATTGGSPTTGGTSTGGTSTGGSLASTGGVSGGSQTTTGGFGTGGVSGGAGAGGSAGRPNTGGGTSTGGSGGTSAGGGGAGGSAGRPNTGGSSGMAGSAGAGTGGITGGGMGADNCMGLAQNLTLSQIAVYQTVKIQIMNTGNEVAVASRKAEIVAGRDAMFRLFVSVGSGWTGRELSGRVVVDNGGTVSTYYAKKTINGPSAEATLDSTFVVNVPKDKITRTTRYYAEIVECGTGSGTMQTPRFPAADSIALGVRETGTVKIKVIPMKANNLQPDTSDTGLQPYKALFLAMYPISAVEFSVGTVVNVPDDQDWEGMLDQIRAKRQTDAPTADIYYYGLLKPTATLREYCGGGCTAGIGYVPGASASQAQLRAALGLAFADATSAETMAHEVGHNHGRNHAPCVQGGSISGVDASFPQSNGSIGVYGWDQRTSKLIAPDRTDIMGYCNNKWISDYTYEGILKRVASVNGAPPSVITPIELVHPWRVLLVGARGPRWGISIDDPTAPAGAPEAAEVLDSSGQVIEMITVYRTEISDIGAFSFEVPVPEPGWASVRVAGAQPLAF